MKFKPFQRTSFPGTQSKPKGNACSKKHPKVTYENMKHKTTKKVPLLLLKSAYAKKTQNIEIDGKMQQIHPAASRRNENGIFRPGKFLSENCNNDVCSVGSCSLNSQGQNGFPEHSMKHPYLERDLLFDDAESNYPSKERAEVSVHSLEMHAYRCTLQALFVSGPLSWEQEELLTNLRTMLHISNDEHLKELRNLIPSGASK